MGRMLYIVLTSEGHLFTKLLKLLLLELVNLIIIGFFTYHVCLCVQNVCLIIGILSRTRQKIRRARTVFLLKPHPSENKSLNGVKYPQTIKLDSENQT